MVLVNKWNVVIFVLLTVVLVGGQQRLYDMPLYLVNRMDMSQSQKISLLISQLVPFTLIIGWEERVKSGNGLNYLIRQRNRQIFMLKSFLSSSLWISVGTLLILIVQILMTGKVVFDEKIVTVIVFYLFWHIVQRLIEDFGNSTTGLPLITGILSVGLFINIKLFRPVQFIFGNFSQLRFAHLIILMLLLIVIWIIVRYIYKKKQVI